MHRRLRRQLEEALGQEESSPHLRKLLRRIDKEYRRADGERASLQHALALLSNLLKRQPDAERPRVVSPKARFVSRLFDQAPFAAVLCDADRKVTAWNTAAEQLFGIPHAEAVGRELSMLVFPDSDATRAQARTELRQALALGDTQQLVRETPTRSGQSRLCEWTVVPLHDGKGREVGNAALVRERDPLSDRYALAWQGAGDGIWDWDLAGDRLWLSDSWRAIVGMKGGGETPSEWLDRIHPADRDSVEKGIRAHVEGAAPRFESEHRLRHEDGSWRWVLARGQATRDPAGKALRLSGSMMDVTDPKLTTVRVLHDALTRLPNRAHFIDVLRRAFARVRRRQGGGIAVLVVDVDDFRSMNARLGHEGGDEILIQVVERLQTCLGEGDLLARLGADEFAVLLEDLSGSGAAEMVASRIHEAVARPFQVPTEEFSLTVSIGIASSAPAYTRVEDLLADAAAAMYRAKAQGRGHSAVFDAKMREYLGLQPPDVVLGVLQDVHWSDMSMGYFPTYALGNVVSVQLWERASADLGDLDEQFERGEFDPLREWLRENVHRHGRAFTPQELLQRADFVSVSCALTPQTRHLVGARELSLMKSGAILVNTARGPVVDEAALAGALTAGRIAGAALDVYEDEPRVHPGLLPLRQVVLAPHLGSAVVELRERMAHVVVDNIQAVIEGRRPPNLYNPEVYA